MATETESLHAISQNSSRMTTCSLCSMSFVSSKILPCSHSFCSQCLTTYTESIEPGQTMACPLCTPLFTFPDAGVAAFPSNPEHIMETEALSESSSLAVRCDVCATAAAARYCIECKQQLCDECSRQHNQSHRVAIIAPMRECSTTQATEGISFSFDSYLSITDLGPCFAFFRNIACFALFCIMCFAVMRHIRLTSEEHSLKVFQNKLLQSKAEVMLSIRTAELELDNLDDDRLRHLDEIAAGKRALSNHCSHLKDQIDSQHRALIAEFDKARYSILAEIENKKSALRHNLRAMSIYVQHVQKLVYEGSMFEVSDPANMFPMSKILLTKKQMPPSDLNLSTCQVQFKPRSIVDSNLTIGTINLHGNEKVG